MTLTDTFLRISADAALPSAATTTLFGDVVDIGTNRLISTGQPLYGRVTIGTEAPATTNAAKMNQTMTFRFHANARSSTANLTAVAYTSATKLCTKASHGLVNGSRLNFVSGSGGGTFVTTQPYYVINATATTWQLSDTPGGAVTGHTIGSDQTDLVWTPHSECIGSSGAINLPRLAVGTQINVALNPTMVTVDPALVRYIFCEVVTSDTRTTDGKAAVDIVADSGNYSTYYASGFEVT
jgi:hypothetical protein